jgi:hypothetical protein
MSSSRRPRPSKSKNPAEDDQTPENPRSKSEGSPGPAPIDDDIEWEDEGLEPALHAGDEGVEEFPIAWKEMPMAVRRSAEAFFQRKDRLNCIRLQRGEHAAYIIEIDQHLASELQTPPTAVTLAPSGMLVEIARSLFPDELPDEVGAAIATHYQGVRFHGAEEVTLHFYELFYSSGAEERVVQMDASGVILSDEPA